MAWLSVFIAGVFEIVWAIAMKYSNGFSKLWPSVITIVGMLISFFLLSSAMKSLPVGTSYAVWTGVGAAGTALHVDDLLSPVLEVLTAPVRKTRGKESRRAT